MQPDVLPGRVTGGGRDLAGHRGDDGADEVDVLGGQGVDDDDVGARRDAGDHLGADGESSREHLGEVDAVGLEVGAVRKDLRHLRGAHGRADVPGEFCVLEEPAVEELEALDGGAPGLGEGRDAETDDPFGRSAGLRGDAASGAQGRLGGDTDVAAQGRVDAAREEVDVPGDPDEGRGEFGGLDRGQMSGIGVEDDGVVVIEEDVEVDRLLCARAGDGDGAQARLGEEGTARVAAGEVVGDDEDPGVLRLGGGGGLGAHTTKSSTKRSGMEPSHTAVVMPDQPLIAWMPSRPAKRVTTQKYESLK